MPTSPGSERRSSFTPEKQCRDAVRWLQQAGFPQYAQMYKEGKFPLKLSVSDIQKDHAFLDKASISSLTRRLNSLNACAEAGIKLADTEFESDEDDRRAISDQWRFIRQSGTWKRRDHPQRTSVVSASSEVSVFHDNGEARSAPTMTTEEITLGNSPTPCTPMDEAQGEEVSSDCCDDAENTPSRSLQHSGGLRRSKRVSQRPANYCIQKRGDASESDDDSCCLSRRMSLTGRPRASVPSYSSRGDITSESDSLEDEGEAEEPADEGSDSGVAVRWARRSQFPGSSSMRNGKECRVRWHSFQHAEFPVSKLRGGSLAIGEISVGQISVLRKLSLLKLTSLLELYTKPAAGSGEFKPPKAISRIVKALHKAPDYKDKRVFGVPLNVTMQRTGQPLPQCVLHAMQYLHKNCLQVVGLFRKAGSRARVNQLKATNEEADELVDYSSMSPHDVADMVKHYFRELPEPLFTTKMSESLLMIGAFVPEELRKTSLQSAMILMPDENREAVFSMLFFLKAVADQCEANSMTAHNLAVCLAPTLFALSSQQQITQIATPQMSVGGNGTSPAVTRKLRTKNKSSKEKDFDEYSSAHVVLEMMIDECHELMQIPEDSLMTCQFTHLEVGEPVPLTSLDNNESDLGGCRTYLQNCLQDLLKEHNSGYKGWVQHSTVESADISYKKVGDGHPLWLWKGVIEIPASAEDVSDRILHERHKWDDDITQWRVIEKVSDNAEVFNYILQSMAPHKKREFVVLRSWHKRDNVTVIMSTSVKHPAVTCQDSIEAAVLATRYILERLSPTSTRLTFILRHDLRGRSTDFYHRSYGPFCATSVCRIKKSFLVLPDGNTNPS